MSSEGNTIDKDADAEAEEEEEDDKKNMSASSSVKSEKSDQMETFSASSSQGRSAESSETSFDPITGKRILHESLESIVMSRRAFTMFLGFHPDHAPSVCALNIAGLPKKRFPDFINASKSHILLAHCVEEMTKNIRLIQNDDTDTTERSDGSDFDDDDDDDDEEHMGGPSKRRKYNSSDNDGDDVKKVAANARSVIQEPVTVTAPRQGRRVRAPVLGMEIEIGKNKEDQDETAGVAVASAAAAAATASAATASAAAASAAPASAAKAKGPHDDASDVMDDDSSHSHPDNNKNKKQQQPVVAEEEEEEATRLFTVKTGKILYNGDENKVADFLFLKKKPTQQESQQQESQQQQQQHQQQQTPEPAPEEPIGMLQMEVIPQSASGDPTVTHHLERKFWKVVRKATHNLEILKWDTNLWDWKIDSDSNNSNSLLLGVLVMTSDMNKGRLAIFLCEPKQQNEGWRGALLWRTQFECAMELYHVFGYYLNALTYLAKDMQKKNNNNTNNHNSSGDHHVHHEPPPPTKKPARLKRDDDDDDDDTNETDHEDGEDDQFLWERLGRNCTVVLINGKLYVLRSYDNRPFQSYRSPHIYKKWEKLSKTMKHVLLVQDNYRMLGTLEFGDQGEEEEEHPRRRKRNQEYPTTLFSMWDRENEMGGKVEVIAVPFVEGGHVCRSAAQALSVVQYLQEMHAAGIAHADICGRNIVFSEDSDDAVLIDFDLAGFVGRKDDDDNNNKSKAKVATAAKK